MTAILGIDVSKATLDVCLVLEDRKYKARFKNSAVGFEELLVWLRMRTSQNIHVCMETTGRYSDAVASFLFDHELMVSVVNARLIKHHAGSQLLRSKTDKLDAAVIADYCLKNQPPAWSPKSEAILELQEINSQIDATTKMIADQTNRLKSLINSAQVIASIEADIEHQRSRIKKLRSMANKLIKQNEQLQADKEILLSVGGIGERSANLLLSKFDFRKFRSGRQLAAFAGVTPSLFESGSSVRKRERISRIGDSNIRKALYWPAVTAIRCNPLFSVFAQRLRERGKPEKVIICAVMRKLIVIMHALITSGREFDAEHVVTIQL